MTWRLTKWNASRPSRSATGGLAAKREHDAGRASGPPARRASAGRPSTTNRRTACVACARHALPDTGMPRSGVPGYGFQELNDCAETGLSPAAPAPGRGTRRRAPRNSDTGRTTRRPATAAPPAPSSAARLRVARRRCSPRGRACRRSRKAPCRRASPAKSPRRLADQIGLADAREEARSGVMPPSFGLPPAIQKMSLKHRQRLRRRIGVGRLGIVDEQHVALAADLLHAMREAGKRSRPALDLRRRRGRAPGRRRRRSRVLRIVRGRAASRCRARSPIASACAARRRLASTSVPSHEIARRRSGRAHRDAHDRLAARRDQRSADRVAEDVVDADDRESSAAGDQPLLDRGVVLHRAVAVEMVRRQVEQDADGRIERGREIDLVGRAFDHMEAVRRRRLERRGSRVPILPPICASRAGAAQDMRDQRRGGRFAVGAGDGDERRRRRAAARARGRTARCRR